MAIIDQQRELSLANGASRGKLGALELCFRHIIRAFESLGDTALSSTALEINRATDVSGRLVAAGGTVSVTEDLHDGKTILLDTAAGSVATLPSATGSGARFRFIVSVDPTSNAHIIKVAASTDDEFNGVLLQTDTDTSDTLASYPALPADDFDTITFAADGTQGGAVGDVIEVEDIAAGVWSLTGHVNGTGSVATPFSSAISAP